MFRRVRETAPAGLVPAAWAFAIAGHLGLVGERPVLIAHVVMVVLLVAFVVLSWGDMRRGVLRAWRLVILAGIPVTLAGVGAYLAALAVGTAPSASSRIAGLALVGVGQTVGIVDAAARY
ncbi:hypothetical protein BRC97_09150 [Halobacteriales archaeon QS_6_71_20]|nr:MAG: hypothetical protein BRC97_09150 [Halobacteriales archaeon QS_6_71_20]